MVAFDPRSEEVRLLTGNVDISYVDSSAAKKSLDEVKAQVSFRIVKDYPRSKVIQVKAETLDESVRLLQLLQADKRLRQVVFHAPPIFSRKLL